MARIGIFSLPWIGHLNPFAGLGGELASRGHEVIFFHLADFSEPVRQHGFPLVTFGEQEYPAGTFADRYRELSRLEGLAAMRAALDIVQSQAEALFTTAQPVIHDAKLDLWLVDQMDYAAATLAARIKAPFVTVILGLMRNDEPGVPGFSGEPYTEDPAVQQRDRQFHATMLQASKPFRDYIEAYRMEAGMGPFSYESVWSPLAQITQQPAELEFPRTKLPDWFHFTGPFARRDNRPRTPFPWERLNGKPLIYASFGTAQNRIGRLYDAVAKATENLDAQVVLSLGGTEAHELSIHPPGNLMVVPFAPQLEILDKASLMITHAGMNSTLECLAAGVPMVAVPIAHDQHGVSARIEWSGTGVRIPAAECDPARLRAAIDTVLGEPGYRAAALKFRKIIAGGDGLRRAAGIIEKVAATGLPVLRESPISSESPEVQPAPTRVARARRRRSR